MPSVIEELSGDEITLDFAHVVERIEDWKSRLASLYREVTSWLPDALGDQAQSIEMNEPLMQEFCVTPVRLPILRLSDAAGEVVRLVPGGLWIIGTNGRVDLFARKGRFIIVDRSDYFSLPHWEIAPTLHRLEIKLLSKDSFLQTIR